MFISIRLLFKLLQQKKVALSDLNTANQLVAIEKDLASRYATEFKLPLNPVDFSLNQCDEHGKSLLMYAAETGKDDLVGHLINELKVDVNYAPDDFPTKNALYYAAAAGRANTVRLLQKLGASLNQQHLVSSVSQLSAFETQSDKFKSAISAAIDGNHLAIAEDLVKPFNCKGFLASTSTTPEQAVFYNMILEAVRCLILKRNVAVLQQFLSCVAFNEFTLAEMFKFAIAVESPAQVLRLLLLTNMQPKVITSKMAGEMLKVAISSHHLSAVQQLLDYSKTHQYGHKQLLAEIEQDFPQMMQKVLEQSYEADLKIFYLLIKAGLVVNTKLVNLLCKQMATNPTATHYFIIALLTSRKNLEEINTDECLGDFFVEGSTLAEAAIDYLPIFIQLIETQGLAAPEQYDMLHFAMRGDCVFYEAGCQEKLSKCLMGVGYVVQQSGGHVKLEKYYQDYVSPDNAFVESRELPAKEKQPPTVTDDNCFLTLLFSALREKSETSEAEFEDLFKKIQASLQKNVNCFARFNLLTTKFHITLRNPWQIDVNQLDKEGENLLTRAIMGHKNQCVKFLLKSGADPRCKVRFGFTPLLKAAAFGNSDAAKQLLAYPGVATAVNDTGKNCVIVAARLTAKGGDLIKLFHEHKVSLNETDVDGVSALGYALLSDDKTTVGHLLKLGARFTESNQMHLVKDDKINLFNDVMKEFPDLFTPSMLNSLLFLAGQHHAEKISSRLVSRPQIDFGTTNTLGRSLLHLNFVSTLALFEQLLLRKVPLAIVNSSGKTICDLLVATIFKYLCDNVKEFQKNPEQIHRRYHKDHQPDFFKSGSEMSAEELIKQAGVLISQEKHKHLYFLLQHLNLLFIYEDSKNPMAYSDDTAKKISSIRHHMSAAFIKMKAEMPEGRLEEVSRKNDFSDRVHQKMESGALRKVLSYFAILPDFLAHFFKSNTLKYTLAQLPAVKAVESVDDAEDGKGLVLTHHGTFY